MTNSQAKFIVDIRPGTWDEIHIHVNSLGEAIGILKYEYRWEGVIINTETESIYTREVIEQVIKSRKMHIKRRKRIR